MGLIIGLLAPNALNAETRPFNLLSYLISFTLYLSYYTLMEGSTKGKTIGKFITKTRSVREDGSQLTYSDAFKRSLSRLVPFEPFSAFEYRPWHDKWTDTIVIKEI
ncbi:MAG: RDD family protein [Ferruginibacter sp.]